MTSKLKATLPRPDPLRMGPDAAPSEPKRDISRDQAWLWTGGLLALLVVSAVTWRATSLPLVALVFAVVPAVGPVCRPVDLPVLKFVATTVASVNGTLLVFLASLAFGVAASAGRQVAEADAKWMLAVLMAAVVSSAGTGVLVRRTQLMDTHDRWAQAQRLARIHGSYDVVDTAVAGRHRASRILAAALAAIVLLRFTRRRP